LKNQIVTFSILTGLLVIPASHADTNTVDANYYTIKNVETHEIDSTTNGAPELIAPVQAPTNSSALLDLPLGISDITDIINIGKQIWTIVEAGKPVSNITINQATAVPKGVTDWTALAGWQAPQSHTYQTSMQNMYGFNVIQFSYRVMFTPGGAYKGKGHYLANVTVDPSDVYVAWGYTFNAQVTIPSITNAGTAASPTAAAEILVKWDIDTVMNHIEQSASYYARGDGTFQALE
jgi:hypothetical protein